MELEIDPRTGLIESPAGTGFTLTLMEMMDIIEEHFAEDSPHQRVMAQDCPPCYGERNVAKGWLGAVPPPGGR